MEPLSAATKDKAAITDHNTGCEDAPCKPLAKGSILPGEEITPANLEAPSRPTSRSP